MHFESTPSSQHWSRSEGTRSRRPNRRRLSARHLYLLLFSPSRHQDYEEVARPIGYCSIFLQAMLVKSKAARLKRSALAREIAGGKQKDKTQCLPRQR